MYRPVDSECGLATLVWRHVADSQQVPSEDLALNCRT